MLDVIFTAQSLDLSLDSKGSFGWVGLLHVAPTGAMGTQLAEGWGMIQGKIQFVLGVVVCSIDKSHSCFGIC